MVFTMIDNHFIENDYKYNNSYFIKNNIIPVNIDYIIKAKPYYENSRFFFQSFDVHDLFDKNKFISKKIKPIVNNNRVSKNYFNIKKAPGKVVDYEYTPIKVSLYNTLRKTGTILCIQEWSKFSPNNVNSDLIISKKNKQNIVCKYRISCILSDFKKYSYYNYYKWIPKKEFYLDNTTQFINFKELIMYDEQLFYIVITLNSV